jgi:predicted histone-like DNA-binding protein
MKYKMIQRHDPRDVSKVKWYATTVNDGKISKAEITKELASRSSLSRGDASNVIENLIDIVPKYLLMGKSVNLGELGTLRVSFSSEGVEDPAQFNPTKITGLRVVFVPSSEFRKELLDAKYEKASV